MISSKTPPFFVSQLIREIFDESEIAPPQNAVLELLVSPSMACLATRLKRGLLSLDRFKRLSPSIRRNGMTAIFWRAEGEKAEGNLLHSLDQRFPKFLINCILGSVTPFRAVND